MRWLQVALVCALLGCVTLAVNLQVPLYTRYVAGGQAAVAQTSLIFCTYVFGLMPAFLLLAGASDRLGRKPVALIALACALVATWIVLLKPTMPVLLAARLLQGVGVGLGMGTCTAYISEILDDRAAASRLVALISSLGFGSGALLTATLLDWIPDDSELSYRAYLLSAGAIWTLCLVFAPWLKPSGGRLLRAPDFASRSLLPHYSIALGWAVSGVAIAIIPSQLRRHGMENAVGGVVFAIILAGVCAQPLARRLGGVKSLLLGYACIPVGFTMLLGGSLLGNLSLLLLGAAIAGSASYGFTYLGGLETALRDAEASGEARAVAGFMVFAYLGFGLPSLTFGYAVAYWTAALGIAWRFPTLCPTSGWPRATMEVTVAMRSCSVVLTASTAESTRWSSMRS